MQLKYDDFLESALSRIENLLKGYYGISKRTAGLLLLQGDAETERQVRKQEASGYASIQNIVAEAKALSPSPFNEQT